MRLLVWQKTAKEALEMCAKFKPDLVTLDILMKEMDGITALKEIMKRSQGKGYHGNGAWPRREEAGGAETMAQAAS